MLSFQRYDGIACSASNSMTKHSKFTLAIRCDDAGHLPGMAIKTGVGHTACRLAAPYVKKSKPSPSSKAVRSEVAVIVMMK